MNKPFALFGVPMHRRTARRRLVVLAYSVIVLFCGLNFHLMQTSAWALSLAFYAPVLVGVALFGGQGVTRFGLLKPFTNKPPRKRDPIDAYVFPDPVLLNLLPPANLVRSGADWENDERELMRRDTAHYVAYQPLGLTMVALLWLAAFAVHPPRWIALPTILNLLLITAMLGTVLAVTLPAAIILWTEPDMVGEVCPVEQTA